MIYYYVIALLVFMLLNTFLFPSLFRRTEREVDYSTFMNQLNEGQIQQVEVQDQKIEYILKDQEDWNIYVTGNMGDPNLVDKLEAADVILSGRRCASTVFIMVISGLILYLVYGVGARDLGERIERREKRRKRIEAFKAKFTGKKKAAEKAAA